MVVVVKNVTGRTSSALEELIWKREGTAMKLNKNLRGFLAQYRRIEPKNECGEPLGIVIYQERENCIGHGVSVRPRWQRRWVPWLVATGVALLIAALLL